MQFESESNLNTYHICPDTVTTIESNFCQRFSTILDLLNNDFNFLVAP